MPPQGSICRDEPVDEFVRGRAYQTVSLSGEHFGEGQQLPLGRAIQ